MITLLQSVADDVESIHISHDGTMLGPLFSPESSSLALVCDRKVTWIVIAMDLKCHAILHRQRSTVEWEIKGRHCMTHGHSDCRSVVRFSLVAMAMYFPSVCHGLGGSVGGSLGLLYLRSCARTPLRGNLFFSMDGLVPS